MAVRDQYRVHRVDIRMAQEANRLERFLNELKGEVVSVVPNISPGLGGARVDFVLVIEKWPEG